MSNKIVYRATSGLYSTIIRKNSEWQCYVVQFFHDNEYSHNADYETDDWQDAFDTAQHWLNPNMKEVA